ncbi:hypothetical protein TWF694_001468 [Orbilia ellipsospora]|uniref:Carboxylesterase type B domain-containing protein n=1 Tax=Orbilia ellipsospora TaxID=2528407 RepID=A0AAV9XSI6_9PEZI
MQRHLNLLVHLCTASATLLQLIQASTSSSSIDTTDLTLSILYDNDLYAEDSTRVSRALLIESTHSWTDAPAACNALGEELWSTSQGSFDAGLNNTLSYQIYLNKFTESQLFWFKSPSCTAINYKGEPQTADCHKRLPVLCTNSAPLANITVQDTSEQWHVPRKVGNSDEILTGFRDRAVFRFFGVRYAPKPERFTQSTVYAYSGGETSALEYGSQCIQNMNSAGVITGGEDCLFLNIWTPYLPGKAANTNNLKPIVLWVHGGGLVQGTANEPASDGGNTASRGDVVFIAINYRLGNFGWLGVNPSGSPIGDGTGNYGFGDMITALKWVKQNAKYFGGDASRVTIMGESGGGIAVRALLASKKTQGLIAGAINQSGSEALLANKADSEYPTLYDSATTSGAAVVSGLGCNKSEIGETLACLRSLNGTIIAEGAYVGNPIIDNFYFDHALGVDGKGYVVNVPLMAGVVRDELAIFNAALDGTTSVADFLNAITPTLTGANLTYLANSPAFQLPSEAPTLEEAVFNVTTRIITDYAFTCLSWATAYALETRKLVPEIYAYTVNRTYQPTIWTYPLCSPPLTAEKPLGDFDAEYYKCHAGELWYTFGNVKFTEHIDRDGLDILFSQYMLDLWASFMWTGNPNPNQDLLRARGFHTTLDRIAINGMWEKVDVGKDGGTMRVLQWNSVQTPFSDKEQCEAMGIPLNYYET